MSESIDIQIRGRTWTITLNRPEKLNALNAALVDGLLKAVLEANTQGARLIVFRGSGQGFCAGFDLSDLEHSSEGDLVLRFLRIEMLLQAVAGSPAQTLALAHGKVFGAGVDLFAACRQRIAAPDSVFRMPGLKFGLVLGTRRFAEIVGTDTARTLLEDTSAFTAAQALEIHFAQRLVQADAWDCVIAEAEKKAQALEDFTRAELYRVLSTAQADADMSNLARSAARHGLKERLLRYIGK